MDNGKAPALKYNVFVSFNIESITGLTIGGSDTGVQIGGVDKVVIRNPFNDEPYIPGSSLRGKIRSSLEKALGLPLRQEIGPNVRIHGARTQDEYNASPVCRLFGVAGGTDWSRPSRLIVRDTPLSEKTKKEMKSMRLDMPYTEVKMEVAIDRITSAATPRSLERVPAGAVFGPAQMVFNVFEDEDPALFDYVLAGMHLVEDSYLGGQGSRGSGQVAFRDIVIKLRQTTNADGMLTYADEEILVSTESIEGLRHFKLVDALDRR